MDLGTFQWRFTLILSYLIIKTLKYQITNKRHVNNMF